MFSIDFLHKIREHELADIQQHFLDGAKILEIGGGTGFQAKMLHDAGFDVTSIDVNASIYAGERVYPIIAYDGHRLPFQDQTFDIVFSSNVLEHIDNKSALYSELDRVLTPNGYAIHTMPTGSWRFWSNITHYIDLLLHYAVLFPQLLPRHFSTDEKERIKQVMLTILKRTYNYALIPRHGEEGNALTEIVTFSKRHWIKHFHQENYDIEYALPMRLFYTGYMILGKRLGFSSRQKLADYLGSACVLYRIRKRHSG